MKDKVLKFGFLLAAISVFVYIMAMSYNEAYSRPGGGHSFKSSSSRSSRSYSSSSSYHSYGYSSNGGDVDWSSFFYFLAIIGNLFLPGVLNNNIIPDSVKSIINVVKKVRKQKSEKVRSKDVFSLAVWLIPFVMYYYFVKLLDFKILSYLILISELLIMYLIYIKINWDDYEEHKYVTSSEFSNKKLLDSSVGRSVSGESEVIRKSSNGKTVIDYSFDYDRAKKKQQLLKLKIEDPNFSKILFLDFVSSLYHQYYFLRGSDKLSTIKPFVDKDLFKEVEDDKAKYTEIVIGNVSIDEVNLMDQYNSISVVFDANYTKTVNSKSKRHIVKEKWLLIRRSKIISPGPEKMQSVRCPNCGAVEGFDNDYVCNYCKTQIIMGEKQWFVKKSVVLSRDVFSYKPSEYVEEEGTYLPTQYQSDLSFIKEKYIDFYKKLDPTFEWEKFETYFIENIVKSYFIKIYQAWSSNQWEKARHLLTEKLFVSYSFWIKVYKEHGLTNKLEDIKVNEVEIVAIELDKFYESITVRIFAQCLDYMVNEKGKIISGDSKRPRVFSEYWTFTRRIGKEISGDKWIVNSCPSCGANIDTHGQSAICQYCNSLVTTGEFYWVLSSVIQDEVYEG